MAGLPLGFYFNPTDADLLYHLRLKVSGKPQQDGLIWDREIYQDEMPCEFFVGEFAKEEELYFFTTLKNKFENGNANRKDRVVGTGFWRTQRTRMVYSDDHDHLGFKTILNFFHKGTKNGSKWIMHEYTLPAGEQQLWAVCRIKRARKSSHDSSPPSSSPGASATPLDHDHHHQAVPPTTQSPVSPPDITAATPSPLDADHSERVCIDIPDDDDEFARFLNTTLTMEDDFLDSDVAALTSEPPTADHQQMIPPGASSSSPGAADASGAKRKATPLDHDHHNKRPHFCHPQAVPPTTQSPVTPPDITAATASPLDDDHSERVCIDIPDDDDDFARFLNTTLTMEDDFLDSDVAALTSEPPTADRQEMIPPADYHAPAILDPPQATSTTHAEFGETQSLPADFPQFSMDERNWLLQIDFSHHAHADRDDPAILDPPHATAIAEHLEPATVDHQEMIPPADYHDIAPAAILDPEFSINEYDLLL